MITAHHLVFGRKYIQTADLNNSLFINNVATPVLMNGMVTRTTDHKGGNTAIQFGSGNLVSVDNLPASPVWSVAFWVKVEQSTNMILVELSPNSSLVNGFLLGFNNNNANTFAALVRSGGDNNKTIPYLQYFEWTHLVIILNRNETVNNEIKIYKNKILQTLNSVVNNDKTGNFLSSKIFIGGRGTSYKLPFVGATSPIKLFNYPLTQTEIDNLYNE